MNFHHGRKLSECIKSRVSAACPISADPLCRRTLLAADAHAHARIFMYVLAETSGFYSPLFAALCDTGTSGNYFSGAVGCKTLSQNWHLAGDRDVFYPWGPALLIRYGWWFFIQVKKGLFSGGTVHA